MKSDCSSVFLVAHIVITLRVRLPVARIVHIFIPDGLVGRLGGDDVCEEHIIFGFRSLDEGYVLRNRRWKTSPSAKEQAYA